MDDKENAKRPGSKGEVEQLDPLTAPAYRPRRNTMLSGLEPGREISPPDNRFVLVRRIGQGGMSQLWLARDLKAETVEGGQCYKALKVVNPTWQGTPGALEILKQAVVNAAKLNHPNIIKVYDWHQSDDGYCFVIMDYLEGRDLDRLLRDEGRPGLGWQRSLELLRPITAALDYAYEAHKLVHRDLKPTHVFITHTNEVKLLNFGLAYRCTSVSVNAQTGGNRETLEYIPPEVFQIAGREPDRAQDIYALACLVYVMLTGEPPYQLAAARQRSPDLTPAKPQELTNAAWAALRHGFAYYQQDRPETARELLRWLERGQRVSDVALEPPPYRPEPEPDKPAKPKPGPVSPVLPEIVNIHGLSTRQVQALQRQTAQALGKAVEFRDSLKDGSQGPVMVVIPAGKFLMGSPASEKCRNKDEHQHRVRIERAFAIGKYVVTFEQYDRFAKATRRVIPPDERWGRGRRPVINVSWYDALAYAEWLSQQTGQHYRLPTEAEWEYAARAGATTPFHFGATISTDQVNYNGNYTYSGEHKGVYRQKTMEMGQFPANPWGLHEVHGNVWEWTGSEYDENYKGAEQRVSDLRAGSSRVLRGGAWLNGPQSLRAAARLKLPPHARAHDWGFRLARDL